MSSSNQPLRCKRVHIFLSIFFLLLSHISIFCDEQMNQSYPTVYVEELKDMWDYMGKIVGIQETVKEKEEEETKKLWERTFDQPYEKTGGGIAVELHKVIMAKPPIYWEISDIDVNTKYKSMIPRFLLEVILAPLPYLMTFSPLLFSLSLKIL